MTETTGRAPAELVHGLFDIPEELHAPGATSEQLRTALDYTRRALDSFRMIAETTMAGLYLVDDGVFQYVNSAFVKLFGYQSADEIVGRQPSSLVHPDDRAKVAENIRRRVDGEVQSVRYSFRGLQADGSEILCEVLGKTIQFGGRAAIAGTVIDVTEQHQIARERELLLKEAQQQLRRETMLKEATSVFASTLEVNKVLSYLAEKLCTAANATSVYICSYDPQRKTSVALADYYSAGAGEKERISDLGVAYDLEVEFPGTVEWIERALPFVTRLDDEDLGETERQHMQKYGAKSSLIIPMRLGGQVNSYAEIWESRVPRDFSEQEIELCQLIAQQAAVAIESGRLYEHARREIEERQRAQEALRQSEQRYRAVAESANTGIAIADIDNRLTYVNPALAELLNYRVEDLEGLLLSELMDPDEFRKVQQQTRLRVQGVRSQYELTLNRRDGEKIQVLISASPIVDSAGNYFAGIGVITDITELKAAQDALSLAIVRMEDALERTRELAETEEALRDTVSSVSGSLNLDEVLDRILENVGRVLPHDTADIMLLEGEGDQRRLRAVRGRGYRERGTEKWLLEQTLPWQDMQNFRRMERTGRPVAIPDTKGFPGWVEMSETEWIRSYAGAPLRHKGRTIGFLNACSERSGAYRQTHAESLQVFADQAAIAIENARLYSQAQDEIAERKRAERALRSSEKRYRKVFEGVREAILIERLAGGIVEANQGALDLFGRERDQLVGRDLLELVPQAEIIVHAARRKPQRIPARAFEFDCTGADGQQFPIELWFRLHRLEDEDVLLVVGRDITDRKLAEEAERELIRMKVQFILSASHSLRTPLHTLMGFLELLSAGKVTDPERQADFLKRAADDAARIYALISDLMDSARLDIGEQGLQLEALQVGRIIEQVIAARQQDALAAQVELVSRFGQSLMVVEADGPRLMAALDGVLDNAIRYSPAGSQVEVEAERVGEGIEIRIRDHGPGIPPADLQALMGHSSQPGADGQPQLSTSSGPGLGLYLANSIVRAHGGRLELDSRVREGTTVRFWLPFA